MGYNMKLLNEKMEEVVKDFNTNEGVQQQKLGYTVSYNCVQILGKMPFGRVAIELCTNVQCLWKIIEKDSSYLNS